MQQVSSCRSGHIRAKELEQSRSPQLCYGIHNDIPEVYCPVRCVELSLFTDLIGSPGP